MEAQSKDYNCGPTTALYILNRFGFNPSVEELEQIANTTEKEGTSHVGMQAIFRKYGLNTVEMICSVDHLRHRLPAIVNWTPEDDGHYGVIEAIYKTVLAILDPADGTVHIMPIKEFEQKWFSNRYGDRWALHVYLDQRSAEFHE